MYRGGTKSLGIWYLSPVQFPWAHGQDILMEMRYIAGVFGESRLVLTLFGGNSDIHRTLRKFIRNFQYFSDKLRKTTTSAVEALVSLEIKGRCEHSSALLDSPCSVIGMFIHRASNNSRTFPITFAIILRNMLVTSCA